MAEQKGIPSFIQEDIDAAGSGVGEAFVSPFLSEGVNLPEGDVLAEPTLGEKAEQIAIGTAEGAVKGGTALGYGLAAGRAGAIVGAPLGRMALLREAPLGFWGAFW